ncbi:MAG: endonuclease domain-containing protein [Alicyclobacillus sp.]|nr:endonuclease domain-containing protein [Alicyclobacillus sp.]
MGFLDAYEKLLEFHRSRRRGPALNRLLPDLGPGERSFLKAVWWPLFRNFEGLHPEYEVHDPGYGTRFIDFAYIRPGFRLAVEIDGATTHWREITQEQFSDHCRRQNTLVISGWTVLRFSYLDVVQRPLDCQRSIRQLLQQFGPIPQLPLSPCERELVRFASRSATPVRPAAAAMHLHVSTKHARKLLHSLVAQEWLEPAGGQVRVTAYRLHPSKAAFRI